MTIRRFVDVLAVASVAGGSVCCGARTALEEEPLPLRPVAPLSTSIVSSHMPVLRWELRRPVEATEVQICRDRECADPVELLETSDDHVRSATALAPGVYFWRLRARADEHLWPYGPTWSFTVTTRDAPISTSWGSILDVNLDGAPDLVASGTDSPRGAGLVAVFHGVAGGFEETPAVVLRGADGGGIYYASRIANAGDVNGDGYSDVMVGGDSHEAGGRVEVYFGAAEGLPSSPSQILDGPPDDGGNFGVPIAPAGDVNGDGYADVVIGTMTAAYVCLGGESGLGPPGAPLRGPEGTHPAQTWIKAAGAGDVDGDGFGDIVVGYPQADAQGLAFLYLGGRDGPSDVAAVLGRGIVTEELFSGQVGRVGDVNGDGYADIGIGMILPAPGPSHALVYFGGRSGVSGVPDGDFAPAVGVSVEPMSAGDLDGDGYDDALFRGIGIGAAAVAIVWGGAAGFARGTTVVALPGDGKTFWDAGCMVGDVDGDGVPDYAAGMEPNLVPLYRGGTEGFAVDAFLALEFGGSAPPPYGPLLAAAAY